MRSIPHKGFTRYFTQLFGSTPSMLRKSLNTYTVPDYICAGRKGRRSQMTEKQEEMEDSRHQLIYEVLRASLEEAGEGFCTEVEIVLLQEEGIKIRDNGRGIPLSEDLQASKEVLEKILSGRPVTNVEFSQMGDLVQAGLQTVNSLCESLKITVYRDGKKISAGLYSWYSAA